MNKLAKTMLFALGLAVPLRALCASPMFLRTFPAAGGYELIGDNVYAAAGMSADERQRAVEALRLARQRIAGAYGTPVARPVTILAPDAREAGRFGLGDVPGTAFVSPVGTQVVLNLAQAGVDVTAHELTHAEIAQRLGFVARMRRLPVWFDEGVAVQLDWRPKYLVDCAAVGEKRIREAATLERVGQFWSGDRQNIVAHYQAAKCAAAQVLALHPPGTLYANLARLREGATFDAVFGPAPRCVGRALS